MLKRHKNIVLLTLYLLVLGFQSSGNFGTLYAASKSAEISISDFVSSNVISKNQKATAKVNRVKETRLIAEVVNSEHEEEEKFIDSSASIAVSHAFFTSFLEFSLTNKKNTSKYYFDTKQALVSNHLYLQFQVFRL